MFNCRSNKQWIFFLLTLIIALPIFLPSVAHPAWDDATASFEVTRTRPLYNFVDKVSYLDASLTNTSGESFQSPVRLVIDSVTAPNVTVHNADGLTDDGKPYFDFTPFLGDERLDAGETSSARQLDFYNPNRRRFNFTVKVLVEAEAEVSLESLSISPASVTLTGPGATRQLTVTGTFSDGATEDLTAQSTGTVYTSSNPTIATVSTDGLVTGGITDGTAIITATNTLVSASIDVEIRIDVIPPVVTITDPSNSSLFSTSPISVSGTIDDETATVEVNSIEAVVSGDGTFTATGVPLQEGANTLTATATDPAGNTGTAGIEVILDTEPPSLVITAPASGSTVTENPPLIQVSCSDTVSGVNPDSLTFTANGSPVTADCQLTGTGGSCTPMTTLPEGPVTLVASISDLAGNTASAEIEFIIGTVGTVLLSIISPVEGEVLGASPIIVYGTVSVPDMRVIVQNVIADVIGTSFEAAGIVLTEGPNELNARCRNYAGDQATATRSVILDTTPPSLIITSPAERSIFTNSSVSIYGIVVDSTEVTGSIDGVSALVEGDALSGTATLQPGENVVTISCRDAAGNPASRRLTLYLDTEPLTVTDIDPAYGAADVSPSMAVTVTFSEPVNPESLGTSTFFIRAGSAIVPASLTVSPDRLTAALTPSTGLPPSTIIDVTVTAGVTDEAGNPLSTSFMSSFTTSGEVVEPGTVIGEVYDDTRSLPIERASVIALASDNGQVLAETETDERGRYLLAPGHSQVFIRVTKSGFTMVDREISMVQGSFAEALDARLTPFSAPQAVTAAIGAEIQSAAGDVLTIPPDALDSDAAVTFTSISQQGPRASFPSGWTPIGIVEISTPRPFDTTATLAMVDRSNTAAGMEAVFARYDEPSASWVAQANVTISADGPAELQGVTGSGQFTLLLPDSGDGAPAPAVPGEALAPASSVPIPENAIASGTVTPAVGRVDDPTPANAIVTITADTTLRSSTLLRGDFVELFLLRAGGNVSPLETSQDLFAYRSPADTEGRTLTASFPIAPSRVFSLSEVTEGIITVSLLRGAARVWSLVGTNGGGVQTSDGSRVIIPPGALTLDVPIDLRRLDDDTFPMDTPAGYTFLGSLELDLSGTTAISPLSLTLGDASWCVFTGSQVVVAEVRSVKGQERFVLIGLGRIDGDDLTIVTDVNGVTFPGVRTGGRYGFYRFDGPLEVVSGTAIDETGRRDGLVVEVEAMPFVSVTDATGSYALLSSPGPFTVVATSATNLDQVRMDGETGVFLPELVISPTPPLVERITVRSPQVEGNFAGPVVLLGKPAPVVDDDTTGESNGNSDGLIDAGERIELFLTMRNEGTVPVENISFGLRVRGAEGTIEVLPEILSIDTIPPDEPIEIGPFVFEVPIGTDVSLLSFMLSSRGKDTFFDLPLDVDHLDVPVDSEIAVYFSEPVADSSLEGALILEQEEGSELIPVSTKLVVSKDGAIAKIRPLETLADDTFYRITVTEAIVDEDGRPLANAPAVERFRTLDLTPPGLIDPGLIEASFPDEEGYVTITGSLGSVNPDDSVIVLNETTGFVVLAEVEPDGSFIARIYAELTDRITLMVQDRKGNETTIDPGPFVQRDPVTGEVVSVVIGHNGGTVQGPDGIQLTVPVGSLIDATELKLFRDEEPFVLPADIVSDPTLVAAFEAFFEVVYRVKIECDARQFSGPVDLSLTPPLDASEGDLFLVVRNCNVTVRGPLADLDTVTGLTAAENPLREVARLEVLDTATVKNQGGELILSTDSPPFQGITEPGTITVLKVEGPLTFFAGETRRDTFDGLPVVGAVVQSLPDSEETSAFAAVTGEDGSFIVADSGAGGPYEEGAVVASRLDVFDPDFSRTIRRDVRGVVGLPAPPDTVVVHLEDPFVLPEKLSSAIIDVLGDLEPPEVNIYVESLSLKNGLSRVGDPLKVRIFAEDNDQVDFLSLEVDQGSGFEAVHLSESSEFEFIPEVEALVRLRAEGRDKSGNVGTAAANVRTVIASADQPLVANALAGQAPVVIFTSASSQAPVVNFTWGVSHLCDLSFVSFHEDIFLFFSAPLNPGTVNEDSVQLKDPEDELVEAVISSAVNNTLVRISPKHYLRLGASYTIHLSSSICDSYGENLAEREIDFKVPQPEQVATIDELQNVRDVALADQMLIVCNHPNGMKIGDWGEIHTYEIKDDDGYFHEEPVLLASKEVNGRPVSLALDNENKLLFVGNHYLGSLAYRRLEFIPYIPGITDDSAATIPDILIGCSPMLPSLTVGGLSPVVCSGLKSVLEDFPLPSNLAVYNLADPTEPKHLGTAFISRFTDEFWNPNAPIIRVETSKQGVGVLNFMENIEIFTAQEWPKSLGISERVYSPGQAPGRCDDENHFACVQDWNYPPYPFFPKNPCPNSLCKPTTELLDAAFFDKFAVILEKDGIRVVSTAQKDIGDRLAIDRTIMTYPMTGTFVGHIGGVPGFKWVDEDGEQHVTDLVFVSGQSDNRLTILEITETQEVRQLSVLPDDLPEAFRNRYMKGPFSDFFGNMSFDRCLGLAFVHGRNGNFHVIDFNNPRHPIELNDPGESKLPFQVKGLGSGVATDGNTNWQGVVCISHRPGVAIVKLDGNANDCKGGCVCKTKLPSRDLCSVDLDVDSDNNLVLQPKEDDHEEQKPGFIFWENPTSEAKFEIEKLRNLENLANLRIDLGALRNLIPERTASWLPGGYTCKFELENRSGAIEIKLYEKGKVGDFYSGGIEYLKDKDTGKKQIALNDGAEARIIKNGAEVRLTGDFLDRFLDPTGIGFFLLEGISEGEGILRLSVSDPDDELVSKDEVYITIKPLRHMYMAANARDCARPGPGCNSTNTKECVKFVTDNGYEGDSTDLKRPRLLVFVHGYNCDATAARDSFDKAFRRFYWTGVTNPELERDASGGIIQKGSDFLGVMWMGDEIRSRTFKSIPIIKKFPHFMHFNRNVFNAFQSSKRVGEFLMDRAQERDEELNLFVHSLGNILVSSAIKEVPDLKVNKYILHEAAVAACAYHEGCDYWSWPKALDKYHLPSCECFKQDARHKGWQRQKTEKSNPYLDPERWALFDGNPSDDDPWGGYFAMVPKRVEMINTWSASDEVVNFAWVLNNLINRPDQALLEAAVCTAGITAGEPALAELLLHECRDWSFESLDPLFKNFLTIAGSLPLSLECGSTHPTSPLLPSQWKRDWNYDNLPEQEQYYQDKDHGKDEKEWERLAYYFQAISHPAGGGEVEGVKNISGLPLGIDGHSAFLESPLQCEKEEDPPQEGDPPPGNPPGVWKFWEKIANELK